MPRLDTLPQEILKSIVAQLDRSADLCALAQTASVFTDIARRALVREITWPRWRGRQEPMLAMLERHSHLLNLITTLSIDFCHPHARPPLPAWVIRKNAAPTDPALLEAVDRPRALDPVASMSRLTCLDISIGTRDGLDGLHGLHAPDMPFKLVELRIGIDLESWLDITDDTRERLAGEQFNFAIALIERHADSLRTLSFSNEGDEWDVEVGTSLLPATVTPLPELRDLEFNDMLNPTLLALIINACPRTDITLNDARPDRLIGVLSTESKARIRKLRMYGDDEHDG